MPPLLLGELEDPLENQPGHNAADVVIADDGAPF